MAGAAWRSIPPHSPTEPRVMQPPRCRSLDPTPRCRSGCPDATPLSLSAGPHPGASSAPRSLLPFVRCRCRDAGTGTSEPPPSLPSCPPRARAPSPRAQLIPVLYLQALGEGAEQHQVHQPPDPPHAAGGRGPQAPGGMAGETAAPSSPPATGRKKRRGSGFGGGMEGAEPSRPLCPSAAQPAWHGSARPGSARLGSLPPLPAAPAPGSASRAPLWK